MHSSLSFNSNREKKMNKKADFHKDVIIPSIYSNENYQFVKNFSYPVKAQRKVVLAKEARVQSIVQTIICKKIIEVSQKKPHYNHRLSKPNYSFKRKSLPSFVFHKPKTLTMDIDEKINQKALMYEQHTNNAKERFKEVMEKVKQVGIRKQLEEQQINFYLTQLSPKKKSKPVPISNIYIVNADKPKTPIKGYVEQNQQRQLKRQYRNKKQINIQNQMKVKEIKNRPKTTQSIRYKKKSEVSTKNQVSYNPSQILFRCNSLMNTKLMRFQQGVQVKENIKKSEKNKQQKEKMKQLFDKIQSNNLQNTLNKSGIVNNMNKLAMIWKSQKQFLEEKPTRTIMQVSNQTLNLLISKRKKLIQLNELDEKYVNQQFNQQSNNNNK